MPLHKVADTEHGIVVRGARILATLAPFADEIAVYPGHPLPPGAPDTYALSFSIPVSTPGLVFLCRDSASAPGADPFDRPLSYRFDEQDAFVIFDDVEVPRDRVFIDGDTEVYSGVMLPTAWWANIMQQTTLRALTKLEFAYGLASLMAEAVNDSSPHTLEMLGELHGYVEITRSAVLLAEEHAYDRGEGVWFPDGRPLHPMRAQLAVWFPRVNDILVTIGSHNLLATPSRAMLDDGRLRPLIDEFLHGAGDIDAERRAALYRLAWDFVGSGLGARNDLYERNYLASARTNRIGAYMVYSDRSRPHALVDGILGAARSEGWSPEERKSLGQELNAFRSTFQTAFDARHAALADAALAARLADERLDLTLPPRRVPVGRPHLLTQVEHEMLEVFTGMGYQVAEGPEAESAAYNFDLLNIEPDHPARQEMDTIYVSRADDVVLRTHTSPVQARVMTTQAPPIAVVCPGRVYRADAVDATHSPVFTQVEGLVIAEGITMAHLRGTLLTFARRLFGADREIRMRPSFFPFTEPSAEIDVSFEGHPSGWLGILGSGMVDPNVLVACGIDTDRYTGFAFGIGVERVAMLRHGVTDIRDLYDADARFLARF